LLEHALVWATGTAMIWATILVAARAFGVGPWKGRGRLTALVFVAFMVTFSNVMGHDSAHAWLWVVAGATIAAAGGHLIERIAR
jgi:hypothetical protein